jgi:hypothetical protein
VSPSEKSIQGRSTAKLNRKFDTPSDGILKKNQEVGKDDRYEEQSDLLISDQSPGVSSR